MQELNNNEVETVSGGVFVNPWTVMIAVRAAQIAAPYVAAGAVGAVGTIGGILGFELAVSK